MRDLWPKTPKTMLSSTAATRPPAVLLPARPSSREFGRLRPAPVDIDGRLGVRALAAVRPLDERTRHIIMSRLMWPRPAGLVMCHAHLIP